MNIRTYVKHNKLHVLFTGDFEDIEATYIYSPSCLELIEEFIQRLRVIEDKRYATDTNTYKEEIETMIRYISNIAIRFNNRLINIVYLDL